MSLKPFSENKSLLVKFGVLYFVSIGLVTAGFLSFSDRSKDDSRDPSPSADGVYKATVSAIDRVNDRLGKHVALLQQLDTRYVNRMTDSFNLIALDDINDEILKEEGAFGRTIDSVELEGAPYTSTAAVFRHVLNDHLSLSGIRLSTAASGKGGGNGAREVLRIRKQLLENESRLANLQRQLRTAEAKVADGDHAADGGRSEDDARLSSLQADNDVLRQQVADLRGANQRQVADLRLANELLVRKLNEAERRRNEPAAAGKVLNNNSAELQRRTVELADELRFAQVDCNLSRVDGRKLVYTSRQRNDLLKDALGTLNELLKSPNEEVQQKARDRIGQLKNLAATVHD